MIKPILVSLYVVILLNDIGISSAGFLSAFLTINRDDGIVSTTDKICQKMKIILNLFEFILLNFDRVELKSCAMGPRVIGANLNSAESL